MMAFRPSTIEARRLILTAAARFDGPFTIEAVWREVGRRGWPSYQHVQTLLRELLLDGSLVLDEVPGRARKPVHYRWADSCE